MTTLLHSLRRTLLGATSLGAASGVVAGLVAITPACAFVAPWAAVVIGLIAGILCAMAVGLKYKLNYDDSLDVVGIHLVGGLVGTLYIGLFGTGVGAFLGFGFEQLGKQAIGAIVVLVFAFAASYAIGWLIQKTVGFRVTSTDEIAGVDNVLHGETAYSESDPRWSWRG